MKYFLILAGFLVACQTTENKTPQVYEGPMREVNDLELFHSEDDRVKVRMKAARVYEFVSGDREFPKGIAMDFYDDFGKLESTLKADHAYFFKEENKWRGKGHVEVKNMKSNEQLNTEELFWKPSEEKITTDKFVTIRQQHDVIYGNGMEAKEDLSDYKIFEVTGTFQLEE